MNERANDINAQINWNAISAGKELSIIGSNLGRGSWPEALEMIADGLLPVEMMATHRVPLNMFSKAIALSMRPNDINRAIKAVIHTTPDFKTPVLAHGVKMIEEEASEIAAAASAAAAASPAPVVAPSKPLPGAFCLAGSVVWVTGSARGIGRAIATKLSSQGALVVIHGTSQKSPSYLGEGTQGETLDDLAASIQGQTGNPVLAVPGDLTSEASVKAQLDVITKHFGRDVDALVCCAGGNIAGASGEKLTTYTSRYD
jgi:hypothetical protein